MSDMAGFYDNAFYQDQVEGSYRSARRYVNILSAVLVPGSVVDLGCGRGAWLKAFKEGGAQRVVGLDGNWNSQDKMLDQGIEFKAVDLNAPLNQLGLPRFDLSMSLEVAEHLDASSAKGFVASLTGLSDNVLFGAAYAGQGGTNHVNEQPHSYWAELYADAGYLPFDLFRPVVWGDDAIEFWYRQNTFLYVRAGSPLHSRLTDAGHKPVNPAFMNCVHPRMYERRLAKPDFKTSVRNAISSAFA